MAKQTAESTEVIKQQIETMQQNMANAVSSVATILSVIEEMTSITNTIAAAVSEQSAVSGSISNAIVAAAEKVNLITEKTRDIANHAQGVAKNISEANMGIRDIAATASELSIVN